METPAATEAEAETTPQASPALLDTLPRADSVLPPPPEGAHWVEDHHPNGVRKSARTVRRVEDGIVNHGPYLRWFETGFLAEQGEFLDGERHGLLRTFYETGLRLAETEYDRGVIHGELRRFDPMNELIQRSHYARGKLEGLEELWWDGSHRRARTNWSNDLPHGDWIQWHFEGPASESGRYEHGARVGEWRYRSAEDVLIRVENYAAGRLHGVYEEYDEQGAPVRKGNYLNGLAQGEQIEFHPGGAQIKSRIEYAGGRPNGRARTWHIDGKPESDGQMLEGQREGRWTYWNSDGSIHARMTGEYRAGERVGD